MATYYECVKKGNRHLLHEFASQYPAAAARCVHWTFDKVLQILFNCAPAANVNPSEVHTDGVAARCEPGLVSSLYSYLGIVEPQMRKTEHLHALLQVLGFHSIAQSISSNMVTSYIFFVKYGVTSLASPSQAKRHALCT